MPVILHIRGWSDGDSLECPRSCGRLKGQEPAPHSCRGAGELLQVLTYIPLALLQKDKRTPSCRTSQ